MVKIKETKCRLCKDEQTNFAFIYYEERIPICRSCINFIKQLNRKEYELKVQDERA